MTRLRYAFSPAAVMLAAMLGLAACGGTPGVSTPGTGTPGMGTPAVPNGDAAVAELCGTGEASLQNTATTLDTVNADTDATVLIDLIDEVRRPMNDLQATGPAQAALAAANEALTQLEATIVNPDARQTAALTAAGSLRALDGMICT
ncbi:hypothetical protein BH23CHL7_BH23CHL7_06720 [soil metagenome]